MRGQADPKAQAFIDKVGLILLIIWVAALQIMLDEGRNHDWFNDPHIRMYGIVAAIGFVAFVIWELTENPIVDLRIFRHRGFVGAATTYSVGFGAFFASIVILPLWLQSNMGYTATWAGYATGIMGILAVLCAPLVGKAVEKFDPRMIVCAGILGLAAVMLYRMWEFTPDVTFMQMAWPTLITGVFMVMFFVPVTGPPWPASTMTSRRTRPASPTSCGRWPAPSPPRSSRAAGPMRPGPTTRRSPMRCRMGSRRSMR